MKLLMAISVLFAACAGPVESGSPDAETALRPPTPGPAASAGAVATEPATVIIIDVPIGSCFNEKSSPVRGEINAVLVSCDGPHQYEKIVSPLLPGGPGAPFIESEIDQQALTLCGPLFKSYVGIDYTASTLPLGWFTPNENSWPPPFNLRNVDCAIGNPDEMQPPGSARDSVH